MGNLDDIFTFPLTHPPPGSAAVLKTTVYVLNVGFWLGYGESKADVILKKLWLSVLSCVELPEGKTEVFVFVSPNSEFSSYRKTAVQKTVLRNTVKWMNNTSSPAEDSSWDK